MKIIVKIRCLFGLRLRQTEGFINYLFELCGLNIKNPDYTNVSKRSKTLGLSMILIESELLLRNNENMNQEMIIKCRLLNRMLKIGRPISVRTS